MGNLRFHQIEVYASFLAWPWLAVRSAAACKQIEEAPYKARGHRGGRIDADLRVCEAAGDTGPRHEVRLHVLCIEHAPLSLALAAYSFEGPLHIPCAGGFVMRGTLSPQTTFSPCRRPRRQAPNPVCALRRLKKHRGERPPPTARFGWRTRFNNEPLTPTHVRALRLAHPLPLDATHDVCRVDGGRRASAPGTRPGTPPGSPPLWRRPAVVPVAPWRDPPP